MSKAKQTSEHSLGYLNGEVRPARDFKFPLPTGLVLAMWHVSTSDWVYMIRAKDNWQGLPKSEVPNELKVAMLLMGTPS